MDDQRIDMIVSMLQTLNTKVDNMAINGCSKAAGHVDTEQRLRVVEKWQNDASGKLWGVTAVVGFVWSLIATYVLPIFKAKSGTP